MQIAKLYDITLPSFIDLSLGCTPSGEYNRSRDPVKAVYEKLKKKPAVPLTVTVPRPIVKNVEVVTFIYKSVEYLDHIYSQLREYGKADGWDVGIRIIANDATDAVLKRLYELDVPFSVYNNPDPSGFYVNRTLRAFNYAVQSSHYNNVCVVNSDMAFSEGWLDNLLKHHNGVNIPCSRLVQPKALPCGWNGVERDFGNHPDNLKLYKFETYVKRLAEDRVRRGSALLPAVFERARFLEAGGYPEGAVFEGGLVADDSTKLVHQYAPDSPVVFYKPSDVFFHQNVLEQKYGMKTLTVCDSIVYHIGQGEKNEPTI